MGEKVEYIDRSQDNIIPKLSGTVETFTAGHDVILFGLEDNTSIQQLIEHIKEKADIDIEAKDIWLHRSRDAHSVAIGCSNKADALKLAKRLNFSAFNGSTIVAEVEYIEGKWPKNWRKRASQVKINRILDMKRNFKMDGSSGKDKLIKSKHKKSRLEKKK